jgi:hypothetical protein
MRQDIRFAGLTLSWDYPYAKAYSDKLHEMGFYAKDLLSDKWIVAYSHRQFSRAEAEEVLSNLKIDEGKSE